MQVTLINDRVEFVRRLNNAFCFGKEKEVDFFFKRLSAHAGKQMTTREFHDIYHEILFTPVRNNSLMFAEISVLSAQWKRVLSIITVEVSPKFSLKGVLSICYRSQESPPS